MGIASGVISILDWLKNKLPIANRVEKIKNDIDKLERERNEILSQKATDKSAARLKYINTQLDMLRTRLQNLANES